MGVVSARGDCLELFVHLLFINLSSTRRAQMVGYTMEAVCILFGCKPNWKESKNLLSKMTFMEELKVKMTYNSWSQKKLAAELVLLSSVLPNTAMLY